MMSTLGSRSLHSHQAAFREVSRSCSISASRPQAASPFLDRPSSRGYCCSSRQAPASQCSAVALSLNGPRSYPRKNHRILESINCELGTYTPGDWVQLFELRFSLRAQQLQQRFPQVSRSLLLRVFSSESRPSRIGSSATWSPFGMKLRWLGPFLPARVSSHFPRFSI